MSNLDLQKFHKFLDELIESSSTDSKFSADKVIATLLTRHGSRLEKIQDHINNLGLRALIRNNCRAKGRTENNQPDIFGEYHLGKRIPVPYQDANGKLRWDKKRRSELSFADLDELLKRSNERPAKPSREHLDLVNIFEKTKAYRNVTNNIGEALEMVRTNGK